MAERKKTKLVVEHQFEDGPVPVPTWRAVTIPQEDPALVSVQPDHPSKADATRWLKTAIQTRSIDAAIGPFRIIRVIYETTVTVEQTPMVKFS